MNRQLLSDFLDILAHMDERYDVSCNFTTNYIMERMLSVLFSRICEDSQLVLFNKITRNAELKTHKGLLLANLTKPQLPVSSDEGFGYAFQYCNDIYAEKSFKDDFTAAILSGKKSVTPCQGNCFTCERFIEKEQQIMESEDSEEYLQEDILCLAGMELDCLLKRIYYTLFVQSNVKDSLPKKDPHLCQMLEAIYGNYAIRAPGYLQAYIDFLSYSRENSALFATVYGKYHSFYLPETGKKLSDYIKSLCDTDICLFRNTVTVLDKLLQKIGFFLAGDLADFSDAEPNSETSHDFDHVGSTIYGNVLLLYVVTENDVESDNRTNNAINIVGVNFLISILTHWIRECIAGNKRGEDQIEGNNQTKRLHP